MAIEDVEPETFELMLRYLRDVDITVTEWRNQSTYLLDQSKQHQSILRASNKYGLNDLKQEAEGLYVKFHKLTVDNVIDNLLYADGNELALLKKAAMDFISQNSAQVVVSESYSLLSESPSLMSEVVVALSKQLSARG